MPLQTNMRMRKSLPFYRGLAHPVGWNFKQKIWLEFAKKFSALDGALLHFKHDEIDYRAESRSNLLIGDVRSVY